MPYEARLLQEIIIPPGERTDSGVARQRWGTSTSPRRAFAGTRWRCSNVELTRFPRGGVAPAGRVIEILGRPGDFGVDVEILIRKHHLPHGFPRRSWRRRPSVSHPVGDAERAGRRDFRDLPIVTIDGETRAISTTLCT